MFLAIWQFLEPAPRKQPSADGERSQRSAQVEAAEACPPSSSWTGPIPAVAPFVIVALLFVLFLRAYRQNVAFAVAQEPGRLAMAQRRFAEASGKFQATLPRFAKQPNYRAAVVINVADAELRAGRFDAAIAACAEVERSRTMLFGSGLRVRIATSMALTYALRGVQHGRRASRAGRAGRRGRARVSRRRMAGDEGLPRRARHRGLSETRKCSSFRRQVAGSVGRMHGTSLRPAAKDERAVLENLVQLYCYDWSELMALDIGDDGRFDDLPLERYWIDAWRHPFLLRVGDKLAGFALIAERSRLTGLSGVFDMAELFVMRRYRRQGVGLAAACAAFDRFKGPWEVRQREENAAATAFWRRAIGTYTHGNYQEEHRESPEWTGLVQTFSTA